MASRYRSAAGASQLLQYFYDMMGLRQVGGTWNDYLGALRDISADDPTAIPNATMGDRAAMWGQLNEQINSIKAFGDAPGSAPLDYSMWSYAPGHQQTAASDAFERYQIRVELATSTMEEGETLTRSITFEGDLSGHTKESLLAELEGGLQTQLDINDTPPEGGWGPEGPGTITSITDVAIMRL